MSYFALQVKVLRTMDVSAFENEVAGAGPHILFPRGRCHPMTFPHPSRSLCRSRTLFFFFFFFFFFFSFSCSLPLFLELLL